MAQTKQEMLAIITAWVEGKPIEFRNIFAPNSRWEQYKGQGTPFFESDYEFRIKPKTKTLWVNIYPKGSWGGVHSTKDEADEGATWDRIACVQVTYTEGEGLN